MIPEIHLVPVEQIQIGKRRHHNRNRFKCVFQSIKTIGIVEPIRVCLLSTSRKKVTIYRLIDGQSRVEACIVLGIARIPAVINPHPRRSHE